MDQYEPNEASQPMGKSPPMERAPLPEEEAPRSRWPVVIGVIGIVLASLGLVCGCAGYFGPAFAQWGMDMQAQSGQPTDPFTMANLQAQRNLYVFTAILTTAGLIVAAIELTGSIALVRRRASARMLIMAYAIAAVVMACVGIGYQLMMKSETERILAEQGTQMPQAFAQVGLIIGLAFGILFGFGWPIFLLVWFSRGKIRDEVEQWREGAPV
jgi:hypothetical protein